MTDEEYYLHYWRLWHHHFDDSDLRCLPPAHELAGKKILEVGAGDGRLTVKLAPMCGEIVAVDYDERFVRAGKRRAQLHGLGNVDFRVMDAHKLELPDADFDYVIYPWVLQMVKEPGAAVAEGFRVLKPGGRLIIIGMESGSDYDEIIASFAPALPVAPLSCYDLYVKPLAEALGAGGKVSASKENVPFVYGFATHAAAQEAFLFALSYWHKTELDAGGRQRLSERLSEHKSGDGVSLTFPASIYSVEKN